MRQSTASLRGRAAPVLNSALSWIKFTVLLGLIMWIPPTDRRERPWEHLVSLLLPAGSVFSRYSAAPHHLLVSPRAADVSATFHPQKAWLLIWRKSLPESIMWFALSYESTLLQFVLLLNGGKQAYSSWSTGSCFLFAIRLEGNRQVNTDTPDGRAFKRTCFLPFSFFGFASQSVSASFISRNQFTAFCYPRRTLIISFCLLPSTCHHSVKRLCFSCDCGDTKQGSAWHCRYGL